MQPCSDEDHRPRSVHAVADKAGPHNWGLAHCPASCEACGRQSTLSTSTCAWMSGIATGTQLAQAFICTAARPLHAVRTTGGCTKHMSVAAEACIARHKRTPHAHTQRRICEDSVSKACNSSPDTTLWPPAPLCSLPRLQVGPPWTDTGAALLAGPTRW